MWFTNIIFIYVTAAQLLVPCSSTAGMQLAEECPSFFVKVGNQCLFYSFIGAGDHNTAKQFCDGFQGSLVTINSATQFEAIINYIRDNGLTGSYWVDGSDEVTENDWRDGQNKPVVMDVPFWLTSENHAKPDNDLEGNKDCIAIESDYSYYLNDVDCSDTHFPLCQYPLRLVDEEEKEEVTLECPPFFVNVGTTCLAFVIWEKLPWVDASAPCFGFDGELAVVDNIQQLRDIYDYVHEHGISNHSFWIGGSLRDDAKWLWTDDTEIPMGSPWWGFKTDDAGENWQQEPVGGLEKSCLALTHEGSYFLREKDCTAEYNPLCMQRRE